MRPIKNNPSKNELVYIALRNAIIDGEIEPGDRLVIDDIARQLQVSPIPVREALRQLEADGFVHIQPYIGASVTDLQIESISEVFALLESLELVAARIACQSFGDDDLAALDTQLRKMDGLIENVAAFSAENVVFHRMICERTGTSLTVIFMDKVLDHWNRLRRYYLKGVYSHRVQQSQQEHWQMYEAIKAGDIDQLEAVIRQHNRAALAAYTDFLKEKPINPETTS